MGGQRPVGKLPPMLVAGEDGEAQHVHQCNRCAGWFGAIVGRLLACDQTFLLVAGHEPAARRIGEQDLGGVGKRQRLAQVARLESRLVQVDEAVNEKGMVVEEGILARPPVRVAALQSPRRATRSRVSAKSAARAAARR